MGKFIVLGLAALGLTVASASASASASAAVPLSTDSGILRAAAQLPAAGAEQVTLKVSVIHATKDEAGVDPKLSRLAKYLVRSFEGYTGFSLLSGRSDALDKGEEVAITLPNAAKLTYRFVGNDGAFLLVAISVDGLTSTVKVKDGGTFFQAGRAYSGGMIVLAFQAAKS